MTDKNSSSGIIKTIQKHLELGNYNGAICGVNEYNFSALNESGYEDFVNFLKDYINEETEAKDIHLFITCRTILKIISGMFTPETVILELARVIGEVNDDITLLSLIEPLQQALLRVSKKRVGYLTWGLQCIQKYLDDTEIPNDCNFSKEEMMLMDADPRVEQSTHLLMELMPFYNLLVKDDSMTKTWRWVLAGFVLNLLGKPLAYFDLSESNSKSRGRRVAETIVAKYIELHPDIFLLLEPSYYSGVDDVHCNRLAIATLFYLVVAKSVLIEKVPRVYNHLYVLQNSLHLVVELLSTGSQFVVQKGLDLADAALRNMGDVQLPYSLLDSSVHCQFCTALASVMVYNSNEVHRKQGIDIMHRYLHHFEMYGRYLLIYNMVGIANHAGLVSYLISQYKNMLVEEFKRSKDGNLSPYFTGKKFIAIINKFCRLGNEESDLVDLSDEIIAALNLLRFLIIRDKDNTTKIWDILPELESSYFEPLRKGLVLSKAHYGLKRKLINENKDCSKEDDVEITVGGKTLTDMPKSEKLRILNSCMTVFDVIDSLLCRVKELIALSNGQT